MSMLFGGIRQIGFVVRDIEAAMAHWSGVLGVGPWFYKPKVQSETFRYYGEPSAPPLLSIALANSGDLQLELIQQHDDARSLYRDSLARNGETAQHVAFWTPDRFDEFSRMLLERGYAEGHAGQRGGRGRYAYFVHPGLPSAMIEISESTGKLEHFTRVREAAHGWDGTQGVRRV